MAKLHSELKIKSFNEEQGIFIGIASTPSPDRVNDIVEPKGAVYSLPLPLLAFHNHEKVIGTVEEVSITEAGIEVVCRVLKDITQEAKEIWGLIQNGAMKGLSIGFKSTESERLTNGGMRFKKYEWLELSVVPVAMNGQASITATKAATTTTLEGIKRMSISEQIAQFKAKKAAVLASMDALITKGATLNDDEDAQYKSAEAEVASIDAHIARLQAAEDRQAKSAQPIIAGGVASIQVTDNTPKGMDFVHYAKSLMMARGNPMQAVQVAKSLNYGNRVETVLKAVAASTSDADFAALLPQQTMASEFIDLLRPATILGKLSCRQVPRNMHFPKALGGTVVDWVGEGKPFTVTNGAFDDLSIGEHKIGAITPFTIELVRRSDPHADTLIQSMLLASIAEAIDTTFIDAANAGSEKKPAAITNGISASAASGTDAAAVRADIAKAYRKFITANQPLASGVWVMNPSTALSLSMMRNANGAKEFEGIGMDGGTLEGLPVITSNSVPGDATAGYSIFLMVQNEIFVAEGGLTVDFSHEATISNGVDSVNLFQSEMVATKAVRNITWTRRRPSAVAVITGAKY